MSDLISRQAVDDTIRLYFKNLIDREIYNVDAAGVCWELRNMVRDIPIALEEGEIDEIS